MNNKIIKLENGGKVEFIDDVKGVIVTSAHGMIIEFDGEGEIKKFSKAKRPHNFFKMGKEERNVVRRWLFLAKPKTSNQKAFLNYVSEALAVITYDYKISTIEASHKNDKLYFEEGKSVARGINSEVWTKMAKNYWPKKKSRLATLYELLLWYAYRVAKGYWSLEYVCDDSSLEGNYLDSPKPSHTFELSGKREVGGFYDGSGNTRKLVTHENGYALCGGHCACSGGKDFPVGRVEFYEKNFIHMTASAVVVLLKV